MGRAEGARRLKNNISLNFAFEIYVLNLSKILKSKRNVMIFAVACSTKV